MAETDISNLAATQARIRIQVDSSWSVYDAELFYGYLSGPLAKSCFLSEGLQKPTKASHSREGGNPGLKRLALDSRSGSGMTSEKRRYFARRPLRDLYNILLLLLNIENNRPNVPHPIRDVEAIFEAVVDYRAFDLPHPMAIGGILLRRADAHSLQLEHVIGATQKMQIVSVHFGSKGVHDLIGIAEVIGHLKDFILSLLETFSSKRERKASARKVEAEVVSLEIENQRKQLENLGACRTLLLEGDS